MSYQLVSLRKMMKIETHDKFYVIIKDDGSRRQVRRDIYWDSGFKDSNENISIDMIEEAIELLRSA